MRDWNNAILRESHSRSSMTQFLIVCLLAAVPLAAEDKPDFSGRWTLAATGQTPDAVPLAMTVRQTVARTNVRGEPVPPFFKEISIDREFVSGMRTETHSIGIEGGFVSGVVGTGESAGRRAYHAVKWNGGALLFENGNYTSYARETGVWAERRETWSLDSDGRLRVTMSSRSSTYTSDNITLIYQRP